jgi:hypothetical protein
MLMVDLVIAVCLAQTGADCHDEHLLFESHGSLKRCMFEAMPAIADWAGRNPAWRVVSFHCEAVDGSEQKT